MLSDKEIREAAHTCDTKYDKGSYVIDDPNTHSPDWIDEMLDYGMSVFHAVLQAQLKVTKK